MKVIAFNENAVTKHKQFHDTGNHREKRRRSQFPLLPQIGPKSSMGVEGRAHDGAAKDTSSSRASEGLTEDFLVGGCYFQRSRLDDWEKALAALSAFKS